MQSRDVTASLIKRVGSRKPSINKGDIYTNTKGCKYEVIEYYDSCTIHIKFLDKTAHECIVRAQGIRSGYPMNPFHPIYQGVGFMGVGKYDSYSKAFPVWTGMIDRVYSENKLNYSTYKGCSVDEVWHNFQNFSEWYENNFVKGWQLDKDLCVIGNKIYGPETCSFVPSEINSCILNCDVTGTGKDIGVTFDSDRSTWQAKISTKGKLRSLGRFADKSQAMLCYKSEKENYLKALADEWKDKIDPRVYFNLKNMEVNSHLGIGEA